MDLWKKLKKEKEHIFVLAPMADVTDPAFRHIINKYGKPDVFWTEFVSADGLFLGGFDHLIKDLKYEKEQKPIIAQFFTNKPEMMERASSLAYDLGFDGIDINMGCPDKSIEKQGAGASLIKNPSLAKELVISAKVGAKGLPVSVKTRVGYNKEDLENWIPHLLEVSPDLITIHARTRKEMSLVPARWDLVQKTVKIRDEIQSGKEEKTLIFGNGDVYSLKQAKDLCLQYDCDGVMFGRAIFGNPWFFSGKEPSLSQRLSVLIEHTKAFEQMCGHKNFSIMKKHYKAYVSGFDGAKELRVSLMETENSKQVEFLIEDFLKRLNVDQL